MEPQDIAAQLRCPSGATAPKVAQKMNQAHEAAYRSCLKLLQIEAGDHVLEIGPGNGFFTKDVLNAASNITYTGIDWSAEMVRDASQLNADPVGSGQASFVEGSSDRLPVPDGTFDRTLAVHTLYFWEEPNVHLSEIRRTLKPSGLLCLAFGDRAFMEQLAFSAHGFQLYSMREACDLLVGCGFRICKTQTLRDVSNSPSGETLEKIVNVILGTAD